MFATRLMLTVSMAGVLMLSSPDSSWRGSTAIDVIALGEITLPVPVWADGDELPAGTYRLQRADALLPGEGEERGAYWIEFLQNDAVQGRELATVVTPEQAERLNRGAVRPEPNQARVDVVRATRYVRLWINHGRFDYLINLPMAPATR